MSVDIARRMKVDYAKVDHLLNFITSLHIVQDMPFGERMLKLSTGEVIKTPKCRAHVDTRAYHAAVFSVLCRDRVHSNEQAHSTPSTRRVLCIGAEVATGFRQLLRSRYQSI